MRARAMVQRGLFVAVSLTLCMLRTGFAQTPDPAIKEGDRVVVCEDHVKVYLRDNSVAELAKGTQFQAVRVRNGWIGGYVRANGRSQPGLVRLSDVRLAPPFSSVSDAGLAALEQRGVDLQRDAHGDITAVHASGSQLDDADLVLLSGLGEVEVLDLSGTQIGDAGLEHLKGLTSLEKLYLDGTKISDEGLAQLKGLIKLDVLVLKETRISGTGLASVAVLRNLRTLNLSRCRVTDDDLTPLSGLTNLEVLALPETNITSAGLAHLKNLAKLRVLNLNDSDVADDGLEHLKGLSSLRMLYLRRSRVTEENAMKFKEKMPGLAVYWD